MMNATTTALPIVEPPAIVSPLPRLLPPGMPPSVGLALRMAAAFAEGDYDEVLRLDAEGDGPIPLEPDPTES